MPENDEVQSLSLSDFAKMSTADWEDRMADQETRVGDFGKTSRMMKDPQTVLASGVAGGQASDQYRRPGSFLSMQDIDAFMKKVLSESYRLSGQGTSENLMQNFLSRLDHHGTAIVPLNMLNYGYTFITRPRLNLTLANLRMHPVMNTLASDEKDSVAFMIRMLLDTRLCNGLGVWRDRPDAETENLHRLAEQSGLVDQLNPFLIPLCNGLKGISGFPDFTIETETTEGDFHSGDFTFAKGSDMNNRTQELSLEFRDVNGSIIMSIIYYWMLTMALQAKGVMNAYPDDIYEQRLNYTVSIYRFVMDPSRTRILWWAKATGCYPKSVPVGALFNVSQGEVTIQSAMNFSVPFVANDVKYMDPGILTDFNRLMERYAGTTISKNTGAFKDVDINDPTNFNALPYIVDSNTGLILQWRTHAWYADAWGGSVKVNESSTLDKSWDELQQEIEQKRSGEGDSLNADQIFMTNEQDSDMWDTIPNDGIGSALANPSTPGTTPPGGVGEEEDDI